MKAMSVKQSDTIDGMGIDEKTNTLVFLIMDPYPWVIEEIDHLTAFQKKVNNYYGYIKSKGYAKQYGDREFSGFRIEAVMKFRWTKNAEDFFSAGKRQLKEQGIEFIYTLAQGDVSI